MPHSKYEGCRRRLRALALLGALLPCAAVPATAAAERVVRIGFAGRMGDALAQSALQGAEMAAEEANRARTKSGNTIRFELLPQDDHGSANMAAHVAAYFVKSRVSGVIGHWSSDAALAAADIYEQAGIAQINFTSTSGELTRRGYRTMFRVVGSTSDAAASLADAAVDVLQGQRIAVIGNDSSSSKALTEAFVARLSARSRKVHRGVTVGATTSDFNAALKSAVDAQADVIFFSAYVGQVPAFLATVKRLGVKANILLNTGATNVDASAAGSGDIYAIEADIANDKCPAWNAFHQRFQAKYGRPPSTYSRAAYNATGALIQAIRDADPGAPGDPARIPAALHAVRHTGLSGEIAFDKDGNRVAPSYTLYRAQGMDWQAVRLFPADRSAASHCPKS